jgi:hypothetical protein
MVILIGEKNTFVVLKFDRKFFALYLQTEKSPYQYRGMFHALTTVLKEEGPRALYKGWLPSVIGVVSDLSEISLLFIKMIIMTMSPFSCS